MSTLRSSCLCACKPERAVFLKKLSLHNFRNYETFVIDFTNNLNIITGKNAAGKTSLIEAINILGTTRSFRCSREAEIISWNKDFLRVTGVVENQGGEQQLEIFISRNGKKHMKINSNEISRIRDYIGEMPVIEFSPDSLRIIKGEPDLRRRQINLLISQINPQYLARHQRYSRILQQRNHAIQHMRSHSTSLQAWNQELASEGVWIIMQRSKIIKKITPLVAEQYRYISKDVWDMTLSYKTFLKNETLGESQLKEEYIRRLEDIRKYEIQQGITLLGPHRDDVVFSLVSQGEYTIDLRKFGAQSQQRAAVIAFKLAQAKLIHQEKGEQPLVLFDDVLSEFDDSRRHYFLEALSNDMQSFITMTDLKTIRTETEVLERAKVFNIRDNACEPSMVAM